MFRYLFGCVLALFSALNGVTLKLQDHTNIPEPIYVAVIGYSLTDRVNFYYIDPSCGLTACQVGNSLADFFFPATDFAEINLPHMVSARVLVSIKEPLQSAPLTTTSFMPYPDITNPSDANYYTINDKVEFTYDNNMLFINTTLVDYFSIPFAISLVGHQQGTQSLGKLSSSREELFSAFKALGEPFCEQLVEGGSLPETQNIRMLSPQFASNFPTNYFDAYINACWTTYTSRTLTIQFPPSADGSITASGSIVNDIFTLTDKLHDQTETYTIAKPTTKELVSCNGPFNGASTGTPLYQQRDGIVKRTIAAAMNRGVFENAQSTFCDSPSFYIQTPYNGYAKAIHEHSVDGKNYAFPYDDVCDYSSGMGDTEPEAFIIELQNWN